MLSFEYSGMNFINIASYDFMWCSVRKECEYIVPSYVTSIQAAAFAKCTKVTSIVLGDSVETICDSAFSECTGLVSISFPNFLRKIE